MNLNKKYRGTFWNPLNSSIKKQGEIIINENNEISLILISSDFKEQQLFKIPQEYPYKFPCILGELNTGEEITLQGGFRKSTSYKHTETSINPYREITIIFDRFILGKHFNKDIKIISYQFKIKNLNNYIYGSSLNNDSYDSSLNNEKIKKILSDSSHKKDILDVDLNKENINIKLSETYTLITNTNEFNFKRNLIFTLKSKKSINLEKFQNISKNIFLFFAFFSKEAISIDGNSKIFDKDNPYQNLILFSLPVCNQLIKENYLPSIDDFSAIKNNFSNLINKWMDIMTMENIDTAFDLYFLKQKHELKIDHIHASNLYQFLEIYYQAKEETKTETKTIIHIKTIIQKYVISFLDKYNEKEKKKIISYLVHFRNYITHYNPNKEIKDLKTGLNYVINFLNQCIYLKLLNDIEFDKYVVSEIYKNSPKINDACKYFIEYDDT